MKPKLVIIDSTERLDELYVYLQNKDLVSFDTETTGVQKGAQIIGYSICAEEDKAFYVILAAWNPETQTLVTFDELNVNSRPLMERLISKTLIMHNGLFDCARVDETFNVNLVPSLHTDTMILAHLLDENRRVGLKELGEAIFGDDTTAEAKAMKASVAANGGSLVKSNYELYKADPYLIGEYGAKDALLTFKLFNHLVPQLKEQKLDRFFYQDESMPLLRGPTHQLNTSGLKVNSTKLQILGKTLEAECLEAKEFIHCEIAESVKEKYPGDKKKNTFNIGSSQQLSWLLFGKLGLEFSKLTKGGKTVAKRLSLKVYSPAEKRRFIEYCVNQVGETLSPEDSHNGKTVKAKKLKEPWGYIAVDKQTLKKLASRYAWIDRLLEYQRKDKILKTYIKGIQSRIQYGVIRPSFLQHGTTSGRYSSRNPNFQNLPRDDKRIKECMVARPGKVFVGADYSQLEPRVFAYYSKDERLLKVFKGKDDFYSVIGMEVYDKHDCTPMKEGSPDAFGVKYKRLRDLAKILALAPTYGATARQLMATTGKSQEDTQKDIDAYFRKFPGVAKMMLEAHEIAKSTGQVESLQGRVRRIPEAIDIEEIYGDLKHADLPYEARGLLNLAVNHRIQSTAASIVNRASIAFFNSCKTAGIDAPIVVQVHDSLVVECAEADADDVSLLLQHAMETTTKLDGISLEAVPKIGRNLAEV